MNTEEKKILTGVIGAGTMGSGIARAASMAGHEVLVYDADIHTANKAKEALERSLSALVEKGKISNDAATAIIKRISFVNSLEGFRNCGLVIEAIVENADIKKTLFRDLEKIVSDNCILSSNTSSLSISSIASACSKPERFIGIHFFNPAHIMQLVEIIPGIATDPELCKSVAELIQSWGKTTVIAKDTPGFIVNRLARPYYGEAIRIYEENIAGIEEIDFIMKHYGGFKMGPFELMDFIGIDINYKVTETIWEQFFYDQRYKPSLTQKRLYESGFFGRKTGKGFYSYQNNPVHAEPAVDEQKAKMVFDRIISMLINEAVDACYLHIASRDDLDMAMTKGVNYPKGLLKWADEIGLDTILTTLEKLYSDYAEDRYRPSFLMKKMCREKKTFYE